MPDVIASFDPHRPRPWRARVRSLPNLAAVSLPARAAARWCCACARPRARHQRRSAGGDAGRAARLHDRGRARPVRPPRRGGDRARAGVAVAPATRATGSRSAAPPPAAPSPPAWWGSRSPPTTSPIRSPPAPASGCPTRSSPRLGGVAGHPVNTALLWVNDRSQLDVTLEQARAASYGLRGVNFITRDGVGVLIDGAAGIVIALLVAVSLGALDRGRGDGGGLVAGRGAAAAGDDRAAARRRRLAARHHGRRRGRGGDGGAAVGGPGTGAGLVGGAPAPRARLLEALDQFPRGAALLWPLVACLVAIVALVAAASAWPDLARLPPAGGLDAARRRAAGRRAGAVAAGRRHRAGHADRRRPPGAHRRHHRGHGHLGRGRAAAAGAGDHAAAARARSRHDRQEATS